MYRFALRGRWLVGLVLVVLASAVCVRLGIWQLDRLDQKRDRNALVTSRAEHPVVPIGDLLAAGESDPESLEWRRVSVEGRYDPQHEVLVRARALEGRPGQHVVTPMIVEGGTAVLVNRGFVPLVDPDAPVPPEAAPPEGIVRVVGLVRQSEERSRFGPTDPATGRLTHVARVDVKRIGEQVPYRLLPVFVQLTEQAPAQSAVPVTLPPPDLGEGPHLSYAVQWFLFATVFLVGWAVLVRRARLGEDLDRSPERHGADEGEHVLVRQADAAVADVGPDR